MLLSLPAVAQAVGEARFDNIKIRKYMPGDIVHIIVEAPFDTKEIRAIMPDEQRALLSYDGRHNVWHGYWEVPHGFKKGVYTAQLLAVDVEGRLFKGTSSQFVVSEPAMTLMVQLSPDKQGLPKEWTTTTIPLPDNKTRSSQDNNIDSSRMTLPIPPLDEYLATYQHEAVAKPKTVPKPAPKPKQKPKKKIVRRPKKDKSLRMAELMIAAKKHMAAQDYIRAKQKLKALLKLTPKNSEIKLMIARLEAIIKAKRL